MCKLMSFWVFFALTGYKLRSNIALGSNCMTKVKWSFMRGKELQTLVSWFKWSINAVYNKFISIDISALLTKYTWVSKKRWIYYIITLICIFNWNTWFLKYNERNSFKWKKFIFPQATPGTHAVIVELCCKQI